MTTKKTTTAAKAKVINTPSTTYIAFDSLGSHDVVLDCALSAISDCEYYTETDLDKLVAVVGDSEEEFNQDVFKVTFTKVGTIEKSEVVFIKEG